MMRIKFKFDLISNKEKLLYAYYQNSSKLSLYEKLFENYTRTNIFNKNTTRKKLKN